MHGFTTQGRGVVGQTGARHRMRAQAGLATTEALLPVCLAAVSSRHGPFGILSSPSANLLVRRLATVWIALPATNGRQPCNYR